MPTIADWRAAANVLVVADEEPRLWLDGDRQLRDSLGVVKKLDTALAAVTPFELALYVAEWLVCVTDKDGPTAYSNIRADLRAEVYQLAPSAIDMSDEDEASFISDGIDR